MEEIIVSETLELIQELQDIKLILDDTQLLLCFMIGVLGFIASVLAYQLFAKGWGNN